MQKMATRLLVRSLLTTNRTLSSAISRSHPAIPSPFSYLSRRLPPLISVTTTTTTLCNVSTTLRGFATSQTTSSFNDENFVFEGCDYMHWLVVVEKPQGDRDQVIDSYVKTLAKVLGSEEEARMKLYSVSTRCYYAFGALVSAEVSDKIKELKEVKFVFPDSYSDVENKNYGGEPVINGVAVPYDPKYHEEWIRNNVGGPQPDMGPPPNMGGGPQGSRSYGGGGGLYGGYDYGGYGSGDVGYGDGYVWGGRGFSPVGADYDYVRDRRGGYRRNAGGYGGGGDSFSDAGGFGADGTAGDETIAKVDKVIKLEDVKRTCRSLLGEEIVEGEEIEEESLLKESTSLKMSTDSKPALSGDFDIDELDNAMGMSIAAKKEGLPPLIPKAEKEGKGESGSSIGKRLKKRKMEVSEPIDVDMFENMGCDEIKKKVVAIVSRACDTMKVLIHDAVWEAGREKENAQAAEEGAVAWRNKYEAVKPKLNFYSKEYLRLTDELSLKVVEHAKEMEKSKKSAYKSVTQARIKMIKEFQRGETGSWSLEAQEEILRNL